LGRGKEGFIRVELSKHSLVIADYIGRLWHTVAKSENRKSRFGINEEEDGLKMAIEGVRGEFVVSKAFDKFYDGNIGVVGPGDVGKIEVRSTPHPGGHLILHKPIEEDGMPKDNPNSIYVLVLSYASPVFYIAGWLYGHEGQIETVWNRQPDKNRPCYWINQHVLRSPASLLKMMKERKI
jgi:hypothetical protein